MSFDNKSNYDLDRNLSNLDRHLDELEKIGKGDLVYYNHAERRVQAVGGDAIQTLRKYERKILDKTNLSKIVPKPFVSNGIQQVFGLFYRPRMEQLTSVLRTNIETTVAQALDAARHSDNKQNLETIKNKIDVLNLRLASDGDIFKSIVRENATAGNDIQAFSTQIKAASKEIEHNLKLTNLFFTPPTRAKPVGRLDALKNISEKGGSIQAYDALTYEEYEAIKNVMQKAQLAEPLSTSEQRIKDSLPHTVTASFEQALETLQRRTETFKSKYPQLQNPKIREQVSNDLRELKGIAAAKVHLKKDLEAHRLTERDYERKVAALRIRKLELAPTLEMIIGAKNFMRTVMSEEGEGSWLDVYSFTDSGDPAYRDLADIEAISTHQSLELDEKINQALMNEHLANKPKEGRPLKAVVEGAGPNGLFSALHLFLAGTQVTVVNDRGERYVRNQIIDLDPKWAAQLRYFMGTKFDELFIGENAIGSFVADGNYLRINTKNLEDALKERMTEISAYAAKQQPGSPPLELLYEVSFKDIKFPEEGSPGCKAKLDFPAKPSADAVRYQQVLLDAKSARILSTKYAGKEPGSLTDSPVKQTYLEKANEEAKVELLSEKTDSVLQYLQGKYQRAFGPDEAVIDFVDENRQSKKITAREHAALELEGKASELRNRPEVDFDFLICCGGASDPIRNKYLGFPKEETIAKSFGVAVFNKGDKYRNASFLPPGKAGRFYETMETLKPHIEKQNFDALIADSKFLSENLKARYAHLTQLILRGPAEDTVATLAANGDPHYLKDEHGNFILGDENLQQKEIQLRVFENKLTFYIGAETPSGLSEFLKDLEKERNRFPLGSKEAAQYDALKAQIDKKWFAAIGYKFMTDGHPENADIINMERKVDPSKMNFDPVPINTSTFPVVQYAIEKAAKEWEFKKFKTSVIITVLGDARASPHFYSGSGMSTGRVGIENAAVLVRDYHQGKLNRKELVADLDSRLDSVKLHALEKGKHFVKRSPPEKKAKAALGKMCICVNETCQALSASTASTFRIIRDHEVTPEHRTFKLDLVNEEGANIMVEAEVSSNGEIICEGKVFHTILDAVISLKHAA